MSRVRPQGTVPKAGSERSSDRASGPIDASGGGANLGRVLEFLVLHDSPKKADELTGSGDGGDLGRFFGVDAVEELEETVLSLPGMSDDVGRLAQLAFLELSRDRRSIPVFPCSLDEDVAAAAVAGLGDGALTNAIC